MRRTKMIRRKIKMRMRRRIGKIRRRKMKR